MNMFIWFCVYVSIRTRKRFQDKFPFPSRFVAWYCIFLCWEVVDWNIFLMFEKGWYKIVIYVRNWSVRNIFGRIWRIGGILGRKKGDEIVG
jgi:hypothetical protein